MTGWKPSLVFRLVDSLRQVQVAGMNLGALSEDQVRRLNEMRARTCAEEERVEREMERQQMVIAEQRMLELARLAIDGEEAVDRVDGMVDATLMGVMIGLERIVRNDDGTRLKALKRVVSKFIKFFAEKEWNEHGKPVLAIVMQKVIGLSIRSHMQWLMLNVSDITLATTMCGVLDVLCMDRGHKRRSLMW